MSAGMGQCFLTADLTLILQNGYVGLQFGGDPPASVAIMVGEVEHLFYANCLIRVDLDIIKLPLLFPNAPFFDKPVPVGSTAAPKAPLLGDLAQPGLGSDRGLKALARGLPVADIVHQLRSKVGMRTFGGRMSAGPKVGERGPEFEVP